VSTTECLHDVVVEDLLWNSLDGNVLKQRGKDRSLVDLLPQKGQIGGIAPFRDSLGRITSGEFGNSPEPARNSPARPGPVRAGEAKPMADGRERPGRLALRSIAGRWR